MNALKGPKKNKRGVGEGKEVEVRRTMGDPLSIQWKPKEMGTGKRKKEVEARKTKDDKGEESKKGRTRKRTRGRSESQKDQGRLPLSR